MPRRTQKIARMALLVISLLITLLIGQTLIQSLEKGHQEVNYCYMILYGRIEDEKGEDKCWPKNNHNYR